MTFSLVRFQVGSHAAYGELEDETVHELAGGIFETRQRTGRTHRRDAVQLLAPCQPTKIIGVGLNYRSHLGGRPLPETPELFFKPPSALIGDRDAIVIPPGATDVHFEGELVLVIGATVRRVSREEAARAIFGVTCGNDVSDRGWQRGAQKDLQWWRAKGCDTFAPLGPAIQTGVDFSDLKLRTKVNGKVAQEGSTADLVHDPATIVSWASNWLTLFPGDLIYTGTPGNTFAMKPGDEVEVEIEEIGVLKNPVRATPGS